MHAAQSTLVRPRWALNRTERVRGLLLYCKRCVLNIICRYIRRALELVEPGIILGLAPRMLGLKRVLKRTVSCDANKLVSKNGNNTRFMPLWCPSYARSRFHVVTPCKQSWAQSIARETIQWS